jgi:hypothetical protein
MELRKSKATINLKRFPKRECKMLNKKGSFLLTLIVIVLILIVVGLWFYPTITKHFVGAAVDKGTSIIP